MPSRETPLTGPESTPWLTNAWMRASEHLLNSFVEANRATLATFGCPGDVSGTDGDRRRDADWQFDRTVDSPDALRVGDTVTFTTQVDDEDVDAFARASGDTNPLHLDDDFAEQTRFEGRIAHGTLVSGLISAALARLPGLVVYLSQEVQFVNPVSPGTSLTATVEVTEVLDDDRYRLSTSVSDDTDRAVIDGEAVVLVDDPPAEPTDHR